MGIYPSLEIKSVKNACPHSSYVIAPAYNTSPQQPALIAIATA